MDDLLSRLIDSYHDVANELSDLQNTMSWYKVDSPGTEKAIDRIRDSMQALYNETILRRAADSADEELK